jgi:hypothetical protein
MKPFVCVPLMALCGLGMVKAGIGSLSLNSISAETFVREVVSIMGAGK